MRQPVPAHIDARELLRRAYALSKPQGMGFMHYQPGPLPEKFIDEILKYPYKDMLFSTDYVLGRAMKFTCYKDAEGRLYVDSDWFDHTASDVEKLLA